MRSLRDLFHKLPDSKQELSDYIREYYPQVKDMLSKNPSYQKELADAVNSSFEKYSKYMGGFADKISKVGTAASVTADTWLLSTGDIVGALGGKFLGLISQIPEKLYGIAYGVSTGNYLDSAQNILEGMLSYIPGLGFADQGLTRIVQKRIVKDAVLKFEKSTGLYKPWTAQIAEKISGAYTGVKDRAKNVFTPKYEPALQQA